MVLFFLACPIVNKEGDRCADTGTCPCSSPAVEVGGGDVSFAALPDGTEATMVHGPQGGWHMLASVQMDNFDPIVSIHYTVRVDSSGALVADNTYRVEMVADGDCSGHYLAMYGYLDVRELAVGEDDTPPELLAGEALTLNMDVTDTYGNAASDALQVVAALDAMDIDDTGR